MTKEQKDLLLKEICTRIPYGVKVNAPFTSIESENAKGYKITGINFGVVEWTPVLFGEKKQRNSIVIEAFSEKFNQYCSIDLEVNDDIEKVKLYLFPLSSMTGEQRTTHNFLKYSAYANPVKLVDWYIKNHFDYHGLIPMGLATDATGLNIY